MRQITTRTLILVATIGLSVGVTTGGCGNTAVAVVDAAPPDLTQLFLVTIAGRWATEFDLETSDVLGSGGAHAEALSLLAIFNGIQQTSGEVDTNWELCAFNYPGLGTVGDDVLSSTQWMPTNKDGVFTGKTDGAIWTQPTVAFVVGAQLANSATDPLPASAATPCSNALTTGCVVTDPITMEPGIELAVSGMTPDADILYVDLRVAFSFSAVFEHLGVLGGTVNAATVEAHVLGCHLRAGGECGASDTAMLEQEHPTITVKSGTLQWRSQGTYFTCPSFEMDVPAGLGLPEPDGGLIDMTPGDMPSLSRMSFSGDIQPELDAMGCATGNCHETFVSPAMHLLFEPKTQAEIQQNYQAVLPFTVDNGQPGGRLANQVPIPAAMKNHIVDWIAAGTPF